MNFPIVCFLCITENAFIQFICDVERRYDKYGLLMVHVVVHVQYCNNMLNWTLCYGFYDLKFNVFKWVFFGVAYSYNECLGFLCKFQVMWGRIREKVEWGFSIFRIYMGIIIVWQWRVKGQVNPLSIDCLT